MATGGFLSRHRDRIKVFDDAVKGLDAKIAPLVARYAREAELLKTLPGFGDVIAGGWLGAIGPSPHSTSPPPAGSPPGRPSARGTT